MKTNESHLAEFAGAMPAVGAIKDILGTLPKRVRRTVLRALLIEIEEQDNRELECPACLHERVHGRSCVCEFGKLMDGHECGMVQGGTKGLPL